MTISKSTKTHPGAVLLVGLPHGELGDRSAARVRAIAPAGVILFARNLDTPRQTADLLARFADCIERPPLLAIDQEGGSVSRLERWIGSTPTALELAAAGAARSREFGAATGRALSALGFNLDFAPVVDLSAPDAANGIGRRAFGTDPVEVARLAGAFLDGLQQTGVAGCLKHFPGLGDTSVDSHQRLPTVHRDLERLWSEDALPFRRLAPRADAVMVGHGHYPALDPAAPLPATCSARIVDGWLRRRIGFDGLIVSDDMEMGAVLPRDADGAAAVEALRAGCDLLLYCADLARAERAVEALGRAARDDAATAERLTRAARRVETLARGRAARRADLTAWDRARDTLAGFA